jgi:enoyl-CoA hydratase
MTNAVLTEPSNGVLIITLNRPGALNAVNTDLAAGLLAAIERLDDERSLIAGILTGNGRGFCSGMDLKAFAASGPPKGFEAFLREAHSSVYRAASHTVWRWRWP